jgi:hypothetical protein
MPPMPMSLATMSVEPSLITLSPDREPILPFLTGRCLDLKVQIAVNRD